MADVVITDPLPSHSLTFVTHSLNVQADVKMKRKAPSELRAEQLKRRNMENTVLLFPSSSSSDGSDGLVQEHKRSETSRMIKYIDTRMDDIFPIKKFSDVFRVHPEKAKTKNNFPSEETAAKVFSGIASVAASEKDGTCREGTFRTVAEISVEAEKLSAIPCVDMDKALKGLVMPEVLMPSYSFHDFVARRGDIPSACAGRPYSGACIHGDKAPLDLTLKTSIRLSSSTTLNWCHKLNRSFIMDGHAAPPFGWGWNGNVECSSGANLDGEAPNSKALYSWLYPQSTLPSYVISAMALQSARGDADFLVRRQQGWEDSFRSLYYMLRKGVCKIFYVCTQHFVVMFISFNGGRKLHTCNAYLSQSTSGLRSLLSENDISFSMPFCRFEVEHANAEDLVELSEIEKHNLGQTRRLSSMATVDNSPQSLLAFIGNHCVHGLYDFLLNYRSFLNLTTSDVPLLCSPVPFQNGSLSVPDVKYKELKNVDVGRPSSSIDGEDAEVLCYPATLRYCAEIKDALLPPWIISGICAAMRAEVGSFEASFVTEPLSVGLNIALDAVGHISESLDLKGGFPDSSNVFDIPGRLISSCLRSACMRQLKYSDDSYSAFLSHL